MSSGVGGLMVRSSDSRTLDREVVSSNPVRGRADVVSLGKALYTNFLTPPKYKGVFGYIQ